MGTILLVVVLILLLGGGALRPAASGTSPPAGSTTPAFGLRGCQDAPLKAPRPGRSPSFSVPFCPEALRNGRYGMGYLVAHLNRQPVGF
jgi:hypothetical protein